VRRIFQRHLDIRRYFVREFVKAGFVKLIPLRTYKMVADALTMSLPSPTFIVQRRVMMGQTPFAFKFWHSQCVYFAPQFSVSMISLDLYFVGLPKKFYKCLHCAWGRSLHHPLTI